MFFGNHFEAAFSILMVLVLLAAIGLGLRPKSGPTDEQVDLAMGGGEQQDVKG